MMPIVGAAADAIAEEFTNAKLVEKTARRVIAHTNATLVECLSVIPHIWQCTINFI